MKRNSSLPFKILLYFPKMAWNSRRQFLKAIRLPLEAHICASLSKLEVLLISFLFCCRKLVGQFEHEETYHLVLRVMVGLVILYDHVHPVGAFARGAHVDVKGCVRLLQTQSPARAEPLLNALRYTTKHLNEDNTPKNIKNLLAA